MIEDGGEGVSPKDYSITLGVAARIENSLRSVHLVLNGPAVRILLQICNIHNVCTMLMFMPQGGCRNREAV